MSKYMIEIEDVPFSKVRKDADNGAQNINLYRAEGFNSLVFDQFGLGKLTPLDVAMEELYQKGLHDGKARDESGCIGCKYNDGTTEHSPCDYCCNAYSNQWSAKPCPDEIEVGDEVEAYSGRAIVFGTFTDTKGNKFCRYWYPSEGRFDKDKTEHLKKTGRHLTWVAELLKEMEGEQRNCLTCRYDHCSTNGFCKECDGSLSMWKPKDEQKMDCLTCKHLAKGGHEMPCKDCRNLEKWEGDDK